MSEWVHDWLLAPATSLGGVVVTAIAVYALVLLYTRIAGLRSFAKMSSFDFAMTVAIGSMVASSILNRNPPLLQTAVALAVVYALQYGLGAARQKWHRVQRLVDNEPVLLMDGQQMLRENMRKARVTEDDLWSKLREANVLDVRQVRAVVMETTGDVTVLHGEADGTELQPRLLTGVRGAESAVGRDLDLRPDREGVQ